MFEKLAVLKVKLGDRHSDIVLRDIQLWRKPLDGDNDNGLDRSISNVKEINYLKGEFLQYIDINKIPLWLRSSEHFSNLLICFTTSTTTNAFFESKLKYINRGIVIEVNSAAAAAAANNYQHRYLIFYKNGHNVEFIPIDLSLKELFDNKIASLNADTENVTEGKEKKKSSSIDKILMQSQKKVFVQTNKVMESLQISEKRQKFNETLSKLILSGLRLRGIPNTQSGFQKIYKMTFDTTEFAHREELVKLSHNTIHEIPFEDIQETVETLLKLFTKS
ncbi:hypothetical protein Kpol_489p21 [Vanderwaltozyma polyspora DSM 70294]|uniref:Mitochondrial morphogenesis protein SLD7 n=1 Tax=Vanderwaltozyma polyspora (strain ATCC 22028 / DSM 70294 / BCRC 21397 / CBS 2163 / NBRC 10782 / NRRL Y-8283 / UCD 57-17) TaxID=436907 RepID=SLD7_VANPO|nr:uncharacterized protein Kpol_489p21 [Vanderwaltozyma polyspora DSM 70294]A7TQ35.1 RecName: Full=Mitochondrial morphogenesis protein SLD7 [Vanderwaltozyma polyspora DSM 70294]EDO15640.1 hypothetical protein Kpol_489p21 [Vanderwaltozyma polyspora DSM 70294]